MGAAPDGWCGAGRRGAEGAVYRCSRRLQMLTPSTDAHKKTMSICTRDEHLLRPASPTTTARRSDAARLGGRHPPPTIPPLCFCVHANHERAASGRRSAQRWERGATFQRGCRGSSATNAGGRQCVNTIWPSERNKSLTWEELLHQNSNSLGEVLSGGVERAPCMTPSQEMLKHLQMLMVFL